MTKWNACKLGGVYIGTLAPARVSRWHDFLISYRVYMMTGPFHISLFEGTLHVDKMHVWFKIANITHALPVPVYRQTDFTPKRVVVARFRTGVKFSPRYKNRCHVDTSLKYCKVTFGVNSYVQWHRGIHRILRKSVAYLWVSKMMKQRKQTDSSEMFKKYFMLVETGYCCRKCIKKPRLRTWF